MTTLGTTSVVFLSQRSQCICTENFSGIRVIYGGGFRMVTADSCHWGSFQQTVVSAGYLPPEAFTGRVRHSRPRYLSPHLHPDCSNPGCNGLKTCSLQLETDHPVSHGGLRFWHTGGSASACLSRGRTARQRSGALHHPAMALAIGIGIQISRKARQSPFPCVRKGLSHRQAFFRGDMSGIVGTNLRILTVLVAGAIEPLILAALLCRRHSTCSMS